MPKYLQKVAVPHLLLLAWGLGSRAYSCLQSFALIPNTVEEFFLKQWASPSPGGIAGLEFSSRMYVSGKVIRDLEEFEVFTMPKKSG